VKFYRYEDRLLNWDYNLDIPTVQINEITFRLVRKTPKGYWIIENSLRLNHLVIAEELTHWVSKTAKKRYAYPTRKKAMENFKTRKGRQIKILKNKLAQAEEALRKSL
jgi:hypothetical protein